MEIFKAYKTSRGVYWTEEEANANRAKLPHSDHLICYKEKEPVVEIWVLVANVRDNGGDIQQAFALTPVDIVVG